MLSFELEAKLGNSNSQGIGQTACRNIGSVIFPLRFQMTCPASSNNYQLNSNFDESVIGNAITAGFQECQINLPKALGKNFDAAFSTPYGKIVFEIEKSNWEKFLYDVLKAHIYLSHGADFCCIILPQNWAHSSNVKNVYEESRKRLNLACEYKCLNPEIQERIFLIGFNQYWNGKLLDKDGRQKMRGECQNFYKPVL